MYQRIKKFINGWKFYRYYRWLGFVDAVIFLFYEKIGIEKPRRINIANQKIILRTSTSDLQVAVSSLIYREYADLKCKEPSVIIDAGANIGTSAIFFAQNYPKSRIFAIEPEEENYHILKKNVSQFKNVTTIKAALSNTNDKREILDPETGNWGYTVTDIERGTQRNGQVVDCITIPVLMEHYGIESIDILKMDIEGGEKAVFESSDEWIQKIHMIAVELHDRFNMGCSRAFYLATEEFKKFEKSGEKVIAYRD